MRLRPDLTQSAIEALLPNGEINPQYPKDLRCKSGHFVPFGVRFMAVSGRVLASSQSGYYCEPCIMLANKIAAYQKANKPIDFDPAMELAKMIEEGVKGSE